MKISKTLALVLGVALWVGPALAADDVDAELAEMRRLVEGLQQKLDVQQQKVDAQEEQLAAQGRSLEEAQKVVRRTQADAEAVSGLSAFLGSLEVEGWVAASYAYNVTNNPDTSPEAGPAGSNPLAGGLNQGNQGLFYPFHGDHDTFKVDQVWFGIGRPATEESRGGFRFDILYGATATFLGNTSPTGARFLTSDSTGDFYVNQAYIEYLAPIGDGVMFTAGKFGALTGAEVAATTGNFNVTRSNLYSLLQPIDHVGVLATTDVGPLSVTVGGSNSGRIGVGTLDDNAEKTLITSVGLGDDALSGTATVVWGAETGSNKDDIGLVDVVVSANPSDALSLWLNFDYLFSSGNANGPLNNGSAWGLAAAGRLAVSDKAGISLRAEYVADNSGRLGITQANNLGSGLKDDNSVWGLTATVDYMLVEDLMMRLESRYDRVNASGEFFDRNGLDRDQWVLLAEAVYTF